MFSVQSLLKKGSERGFTLLELQIAIFILMFAVAGLSLIFMNYTKQIQWEEMKRMLHTVVVPSPNDVSKVVFTEYRTGNSDSRTVYKVIVKSLTEDADSVTAVTLLEGK